MTEKTVPVTCPVTCPVAVLSTGPETCSTAEVLVAHLRAAHYVAMMHVRVTNDAHAGHEAQADEWFRHTPAHLRTLYQDGIAIVALCSTGIIIRSLAPLLYDKMNEPPVLALSPTGDTVIPLLGGHRGGNELAQVCADTFATRVSRTNHAECAYPILDSPPSGWHVHNADSMAVVMNAMRRGAPVALHIEEGDASWLDGFPLDATPQEADHTLHITARPHEVADAHAPVLIPPVLALGVGCESGTATDEIIALTEQVLNTARMDARAIACVVSIDLKADENAVHALAAHLGVPARFYDAVQLNTVKERLQNPSTVVFAETGCYGVAEGAALCAAGDEGALLVAKQKSKRATAALAMGRTCIDGPTVGQARGRLAIVGIGPGTPAWRTPEATRLLMEAEHVVGYELYLDLVANVIGDTPRHSPGLSHEEERVRKALQLAADGARVALVCSGDAGIYALASLVFDVLERADDARLNRIEIITAPGISAIQAAAARAGAPIGHDFCTVSLSDLLTPWTDIVRRLNAAAKGDFITALYNPVSARRRHQLVEAKAIMLAHRAPDTPVIVARNLGRTDEEVRFITLDALDVDAVDMLTLVIIGSTNTRRITCGRQAWVYTPRGYRNKHHAQET